MPPQQHEQPEQPQQPQPQQFSQPPEFSQPPAAPPTPEQQMPQPPKRRSGAVLGIVLAVVVFIVAFIIVSVLLRASNHAGKNTNNSATATSWRSFTSTQYGFSQSFPGSPTTSNSSMTIEGSSTPTTTYEQNNGGSYFATKVISYPLGLNMADTNLRLQDALNALVASTQGAKLTSSSFTQLAGNSAITGVITVTQGNLSLQQHVAALLKGNTMFLFISSAASASDFDTFTSSFKFN